MATAAVGTIALAAALGNAQNTAGGQHHNELTLAGLRPGKSTLPSAQRAMAGFGTPKTGSTGVYWDNHCDGRVLRVEADSSQVVQTVTASILGARFKELDCIDQDEAKLKARLRTGRGLELGDACARVTELYGKPESRGPSVEGSRKLELLFYSFDWAGENVPQSMEVSCDAASERVVEITLASSSL